jgi:hypothetical protein
MDHDEILVCCWVRTASALCLMAEFGSNHIRRSGSDRFGQHIMIGRLKAGIVEPTEMFIARQRIGKHAPASTNT